jgi:hypothetical protein
VKSEVFIDVKMSIVGLWVMILCSLQGQLFSGGCTSSQHTKDNFKRSFTIDVHTQKQLVGGGVKT